MKAGPFRIARLGLILLLCLLPGAVAAFEQLMAGHSKAVQPEWKEHYVHALLAANRPRQALPVIQELSRRYTGDRKTRWQETLLYLYLEFGMTPESLSRFVRSPGKTPPNRSGGRPRPIFN